MATTITAAAEIERLTDGRNRIRDKLIELGLAVSTDTLDVLAAAIEDIINQGAVQVEILEGTSYTIPAGFHNGSGTVKAMTDTTGEAEKYKVQAKTITPTKNQQSVAPDTGYYALSAVTVNAIPAAYQNVSSVNAAAGDVLVGKIIVTADGKVTTGTMANNGAATQLLDCTTVTYTIPVGYHDGKGTVSITLEEKTATPTKATQTITPTSGKVLKKVTVNPIPDEYITTDDADAVAANILADKTAYVDGVKVTGTMPVNQGVGYYYLTPGDETYEVPEGFHYDGGSVIKVPVARKQVITPTKEEQKPYALIHDTETGKSYPAFFSEVVVNPIPDEYITTDDADAVAANILANKTAYVDGVKVTGSMTDRGAASGSINGLTVTEYTIPAGYHNGSGKITLTDDIAKALAEI